MGTDTDHYSLYEAAQVLGISPARVRQMLRAGELEGERGEQRIEGVMGPWRLPASGVHAARSVVNVGEARGTVVMPSEGAAAPEVPASGGETHTPSETSERLSEGVQNIREKAETLIADLDALEGRLEATEVEQLAQREALWRAEERVERLRTKLEEERARTEPQEQRGAAWWRWVGG